MRPRVGFLGVGWIGRHRMAAMIEGGEIEAAAICDPSPEMRAEASALAPDATCVECLEELLDLPLDGVAIATPSAQHAAEAIRCLEAGRAVFCQKPVGRDATEAAAIVEAARRADRLLSADFSYRRAESVVAMKRLVDSGALGRLFAAELVFHNAYGPDKPWFYDKARAGGGCLVDLGVHLVDLAMWITGFHAPLTDVSARLMAGGRRIRPGDDAVEDYAVASATLAGTIALRLGCSWRLHAGEDARIEFAIYGTEGGAITRNVGGSFYDFVAEHAVGTKRTVLATPPDAWGGRAACDWATRLSRARGFAPEAQQFVTVMRALDAIYAVA